MKIEILGGRLFDPVAGIDEVADLFVGEGRILAHGTRPAGFVADKTISANGHLVIAGIVDLCASLRSESKARLRTEVRAAVKGGVTSLCCPPDASPINDSGGVTSLILDLARDTGMARVFPIGALTQGLKGEQLSELFGLKDAGCRLVSNMRYPVKNTRVLRRCLEYARSHDVTVYVCPEDHALAADGCVHEGFISTRLGLPGVPALAEILAVSQMLLMVEDTGVRTHFSQLSTARAVDLIAQAQKRGLPVSADVTIYHLMLTEQAIDGFDSRYHLQPPLRSEADREGLRQALREGVVTAICSQHQPHELAAKQAPFAETEPGLIGLETLLPLVLKLVEQKVLDLGTAIAALTSGPAQVLGEELGSLAVGRPADLCVVDLARDWQLSDKHIFSACRNTPYLNQTLKGMVQTTLVAGRPVYEAE